MITHARAIHPPVAHPPVSSDRVYVKIAAPVQRVLSPSKISGYPPAVKFSEGTLTPVSGLAAVQGLREVPGMSGLIEPCWSQDRRSDKHAA
ncbi:hypothetical protein [Micromonospora chersina]|uniref:hypothetical protein n=1 Tax=Micromonospora chersina TaxID=47854 RepID=UPI003D95092D